MFSFIYDNEGFQSNWNILFKINGKSLSIFMNFLIIIPVSLVEYIHIHINTDIFKKGSIHPKHKTFMLTTLVTLINSHI